VFTGPCFVLQLEAGFEQNPAMSRWGIQSATATILSRREDIPAPSPATRRCAKRGRAMDLTIKGL